MSRAPYGYSSVPPGYPAGPNSRATPPTTGGYNQNPYSPYTPPQNFNTASMSTHAYPSAAYGYPFADNSERASPGMVPAPSSLGVYGTPSGMGSGMPSGSSSTRMGPPPSMSSSMHAGMAANQYPTASSGISGSAHGVSQFPLYPAAPTGYPAPSYYEPPMEQYDPSTNPFARKPSTTTMPSVPTKMPMYPSYPSFPASYGVPPPGTTPSSSSQSRAMPTSVAPPQYGAYHPPTTSSSTRTLPTPGSSTSSLPKGRSEDEIRAMREKLQGTQSQIRLQEEKQRQEEEDRAREERRKKEEELIRQRRLDVEAREKVKREQELRELREAQERERVKIEQDRQKIEQDRERQRVEQERQRLFQEAQRAKDDAKLKEDMMKQREAEMRKRRSQLEQEERDKKEMERREKERREADEVRRREQERLQREIEEKRQRELREAQEKARREAEEKARREAEEIARREAEERGKREAEERLRREVQEKARQEEQAKREAEERDRREAEERAREQARLRFEAQKRLLAQAEEENRLAETKKLEQKQLEEKRMKKRNEEEERRKKEGEENQQREAEAKRQQRQHSTPTLAQSTIPSPEPTIRPQPPSPRSHTQTPTAFLSALPTPPQRDEDMEAKRAAQARILALAESTEPKKTQQTREAVEIAKKAEERENQGSLTRSITAQRRVEEITEERKRLMIEENVRYQREMGKLIDQVGPRAAQGRLLAISEHEEKVKAIPEIAKTNVEQRYKSSPTASKSQSRLKLGNLSSPTWGEPPHPDARALLYMKVAFGRNLDESDWLYPYFVISRIDHYGRASEEAVRLFRSDSLSGNNVSWMVLVRINIFDPYDDGVSIRVMHERTLGSNLVIGTKKWPIAVLANTSEEKLNVNPWYRLMGENGHLTPAEVQILFKYVERKDKQITGPMNVVHNSGMRMTSSGKVEITGIPYEWKELFKKANIKKRDLEDPNNFKVLINALVTSVLESQKQTSRPQPVKPERIEEAEFDDFVLLSDEKPKNVPSFPARPSVPKPDIPPEEDNDSPPPYPDYQPQPPTSTSSFPPISADLPPPPIPAELPPPLPAPSAEPAVVREELPTISLNHEETQQDISPPPPTDLPPTFLEPVPTPALKQVTQPEQPQQQTQTQPTLAVVPPTPAGRLPPPASGGLPPPTATGGPPPPRGGPPPPKGGPPSPAAGPPPPKGGPSPPASGPPPPKGGPPPPASGPPAPCAGPALGGSDFLADLLKTKSSLQSSTLQLPSLNNLSDAQCDDLVSVMRRAMDNLRVDIKGNDEAEDDDSWSD